MSERVAGFTPETARQLLGMVRDGRTTGKQSVVYPEPSRAVAVGIRKSIAFELEEPLAAEDEDADATVLEQFGPGTSTSETTVTVRNGLGPKFFGVEGAKGLAMWDQDEDYVIIQLQQDCTPEDEEEPEE